MSKFIGVKMVEAVPMTASEALQKDYRVGQNGTIIAPSTRGYEVTYEDGYKSWCPKDVFERNNVLIQGLNGKIIVEPGTENEPFIQRVIDEYNELNVKYNKLMTFIDNEEGFNKLDKDDQDDLILQANIMIAYISILNKRIARLIKKYPPKELVQAG